MKKLLARLSEKKLSRALFVAVILIVYLACIPSVLRAFREQKQSKAVSQTAVTAEEVVAAAMEETGSVPETASTPAPVIPSVTRAPEIKLGSLTARAGEFGDFTTAGMDYFEDALFIGDSRAHYMYLYGTIKNADFYAADGMDTFDIHSKSSECDGTDMSFGDFLTHKRYGKVYLMLGLNDLGYDRVSFYKNYRSLLQEIRSAQPDAVIFLHANLLLTSEVSAKSSVQNNQALIDVNNIISTLADGVDIVYIDVNPLYTDETGAVRKSYTHEGTHLYGKYYEDWCDWLMTRAVVR